MDALTREDLMTLERYAEERPAFRKKVMAHKKFRRVALGPHLSLYFEDRLTIQYQVQEMLRIEKIFEGPAIEEELQAYNPLIPGGSNLKCTAMLEYRDVEERHVALAALRGIEDLVWVQVAGFEKSFAVANEDLERSNEEKTSAVHFMRFEFTGDMIAALAAGAELTMGVNHAAYNYEAVVSGPGREALLVDLVA